MAEKRVQRRLAAVVAVDVVGYSRMMGADEADTLARLKALRADFLHPKVAEYGGRIVKTTGDGTLIEFLSAVDAVQHAVDVQSEMARRNDAEPEAKRIVFRMGINLGDIIIDGEDIYGDGVNVAARIEGLAEPGATWISSSVYEQVRQKLELKFDDMGEQVVKNIADPIHVYRIATGSFERQADAAISTDAMFRRPAVAVLPFENLSGDLEQEYFADGLTEDIITALSLFRSFPVIARNSTFTYKGTSPDIRKVGKALGARYVVEGSVRKAGNRVRVTAQLINADTGHHVWAERFDHELEDIFQLQDDLTERIVATVAPELERTESKRVIHLGSVDLSVWDYVHRGMGCLNRFTAEDHEFARQMFEHAIAVDPNCAAAVAGIAWSHVRDLEFGFAKSPSETKAIAIEMAQRAVTLDESNPLTHFVLGICHIWNNDIAMAAPSLRRALELNPNTAQAKLGLGIALTVSGEAEQGLRHMTAALRLNPQDPRSHLYHNLIAWAHLALRRYDEALKWVDRAIQWRADFPQAHLVRASVLAHLGRDEEASLSLQRCDEIRSGFTADRNNWPFLAGDGDDNHFLGGLRKAGWQG